MSLRHDEEALLSCGCIFNTNGLSVKNNESVSCRRHGPQTVIVPSLNEYTVLCKTCPYQSSHRGARLNAEISGAKHLVRRPKHVVEVLKPGGELHYVYKNGNSDTLGDW